MCTVAGAVETLGGEQAISAVHADPTRQLDLRYHPASLAPLHGDRQPTQRLLLRITRKRKRSAPPAATAGGGSDSATADGGAAPAKASHRPFDCYALLVLYLSYR